jgi:D-lactate dehydrogenase
VKYGTTRDNVLGLRAVTGTGAFIRTGTRTTKGVVGYDLTRLLVGAEGTLALITEATLKLTPLPETRRTLAAQYHDMESAARAVARIMAQPVTPCALEFIDGRALDLIRRNHPALDIPDEAGALLMIEVDGPQSCIDAAADAMVAAARTDGLLSLARARDEADVERIWTARKALSPTLRQIAPKKINEDVVVPVSRMPALIGGLDTLATRHAVTIVSFGHAGNGNIHINLLVNPDDPEEMRRAHACLDEVFALVLTQGGTLSGEHGIGSEKRMYVDRETGAAELDLMHAIRRQFDPQGILNPWKKLPPAPGAV